MQRKEFTMNEEKFLEKVISTVECSLPILLNYSKYNFEEKRNEQVIMWYCNDTELKFYLITYPYCSTEEIVVAELSAKDKTEFLWMRDSLEEYMDFNIPKYFETYEFIIKSRKVTCKHTESNNKHECTFFFQ